METTTTSASGESGVAGATRAAAYVCSDPQDALGPRISSCVVKAFDSMGVSHATQDVIFWNLSVTKGLGRGEVVDKPSEFLDGLRGIFGEAGLVVFEYKLGIEISREFELDADFEESLKQSEKSGIPGLITQVVLALRDTRDR